MGVNFPFCGWNKLDRGQLKLYVHFFSNFNNHRPFHYNSERMYVSHQPFPHSDSPSYSVRGCVALLMASSSMRARQLRTESSAGVWKLPPQHLLIERCINVNHPSLPFFLSTSFCCIFHNFCPPSSVCLPAALSTLSPGLLITALCVGFFSGRPAMAH